MATENAPLLRSDKHEPNNSNNDEDYSTKIREDNVDGMKNIHWETNNTTSADKDVHNNSNIDNELSKATYSSWLRLSLFFMACVLSGGIIPGQNVYNGLLCEAGLFSYACHHTEAYDGSVNANVNVLVEVEDQNPGIGACCSAQWLLVANVMNTLSVSLAFFFFLGGLIFDSIGGQWAGVVGCCINAFGFSLLAALLSVGIAPLVEMVIFCIAVICIDAGSIIANVSFFGFLWHLPRHQALVLSLSNCCTNVAALVPLLLRFILRRYSTTLSLPSIFFLYAMVILTLAAPMSWSTVPSIDEYRSRAMEVLGMPIPRRTVRGVCEAIKDVKAGARILKQHARLHYFTLGAFVFAWVSPLVYMTMTEPLGQEIFGSGNTSNNDNDGGGGNSNYSESSGERLATLYNQSSAALGLFIGPMLGLMVDRYKRPADGIVHLAVTITILFAVIGFFCPVADWTMQTVIVTVACFGQIAMSLLVLQYALIFAPPNRVGAVTGILSAAMGVTALPLFLLVSADIGIYGSYIKPTVLINITGFVVWIYYVKFLKRTNPFPNSPVFLPEDEYGVAKMFGVGILEDAAFVAGKSLQEFRRLASSSNIMDQRLLLNLAMTVEAGERVMTVARQYSSSREEMTIPTIESGVLMYHIPLNLANGNVRGEEYIIRRGTTSSALETVEISFNGHGGFGGKREPTFDWMLTLIGPPDEPRRIAVTHSIFAPVFSCAEAYGTILEVQVGNITVASCACFHPGGLEKDGSIFQVGSDRYYYSMTKSGATPTTNHEIMGTETLQRVIGLKQDQRWDEYRKNYGPMFYVAILGVHPSYQGRGYGKKLLSIVANWADHEGMDCYLESSEANLPIYERCGYKTIWREDVKVDQNNIVSNFGMARKYKAEQVR